MILLDSDDMNSAGMKVVSGRRHKTEVLSLLQCRGASLKENKDGHIETFSWDMKAYKL